MAAARTLLGPRPTQVTVSLADAVEDLVRDMETIVLNLPDTTKRAHEIGQVNRARKLARVVRAAGAEARRQTPGSMTTLGASPPHRRDEPRPVKLSGRRSGRRDVFKGRGARSQPSAGSLRGSGVFLFDTKRLTASRG